MLFESFLGSNAVKKPLIYTHRSIQHVLGAHGKVMGSGHATCEGVQWKLPELVCQGATQTAMNKTYAVCAL